MYLYTAAPGAFPSNTYNSANYWVDVVFAPGTTYSISGNDLGNAAEPARLCNWVARSRSQQQRTGSGTLQLRRMFPRHLSVTPTSAVGFVPGTQTVTVSQANVTGRELQHVPALSLQFHLGSVCRPLLRPIQRKPPRSSLARSSLPTLTGISSASASISPLRTRANMWRICGPGPATESTWRLRMRLRRARRAGSRLRLRPLFPSAPTPRIWHRTSLRQGTIPMT